MSGKFRLRERRLLRKKTAERNSLHEVAAETAPDEPKKFALLGYEVGGWGALLAFVIAMISLGWQVVAYLQGPKASIRPLRSVELTCSLLDEHSECASDSKLILVASRLALENRGASGYDTSIDPGKATVSFWSGAKEKLRSIELTAQYFTNRVVASDHTQKAASIIYLKAGSGADYEVEYYPRYIIEPDSTTNRANFIKFTQFLTFIADGIDGKSVSYLTITLKVRAIGRNRGDLATTCKIVIDSAFKANAKDGGYGTFPRDCVIES